jgi:hypothetical protein
LFAWGLAGTTATAAGTLSLAEPLAAVALGVLVLNEHLTVNATIGSLMLLSGLAVVAVPSRRPSLPASRAAANAGPAEPLLSDPGAGRHRKRAVAGRSRCLCAPIDSPCFSGSDQKSRR